MNMYGRYANLDVGVADDQSHLLLPIATDDGP